MKTLRIASVVACCALSTSAALAIDLDPLWDFGKPELSEQRFRAAQAAASADDALILQTQIARTYGLRRDFPQARAILAAMAPQLKGASAEARVRHALESGRALSSATHARESQTAEVREQARASYLRAFDLATAAQLDGLAVDALHMLAFVDTEPADRLKWGLRALSVVDASTQPEAKQWEASLRNNVGYALHQLGRYDEALAQLQRAAVLRERGSSAKASRIAHWMVAWTLRALERNDEALAIQLRLERECDAAGEPDPYVFEELEILYRARGDEPGAQRIAARRKALPHEP